MYSFLVDFSAKFVCYNIGSQYQVYLKNGTTWSASTLCINFLLVFVIKKIENSDLG